MHKKCLQQFTHRDILFTEELVQNYTKEVNELKKVAVKDPDHLHELIIKSGFTIRSFSKEINISHPLLAQIISSNRNPSPTTAKKICDGLNKKYDDIFFIVDVNKSTQPRSA